MKFIRYTLFFMSCFFIQPSVAKVNYKVSSKKKIYENLNLSHNQAKSMFLINKKKKIKIKHLKSALVEVQKKINELLENDGVEDEIRLWHKKKIIIQAKIKQEKFMGNMRIRRLLDQKQRTQYIKMKKEIMVANKKRNQSKTRR